MWLAFWLAGFLFFLGLFDVDTNETSIKEDVYLLLMWPAAIGKYVNDTVESVTKTETICSDE